MTYPMGLEKKVLYVQTFGGFSMTWNQTQVAGGSKARESQFVYLMEFLLHQRQKGVSRSELEEVLFGDRELHNVHHALRTVIYNAKKKLKAAGLPEANYIQQRGGLFYWTEEIPVVEDAQEFEELYEKAQREEEEKKRLELLYEACLCYGGEFLPQQGSFIWVVQEARRLQSLFFSCMEETAILLRETQDWIRMRELGVYASKVSPFADWEVITMEALVSMGCLEDARRLYDDTVEFYVKEQGFRPSRKMLELMDRMAVQINHQYAMLDAIQMELSCKEEESSGGYLCSYPVFRGIYHMIERMIERGGQSVYLMLCTLVDSKGNPMTEGTLLEALSKRMEEAICVSVRHTDAVSRYGRGQYLVLLVNTTRENCSIVQKRINYKFIIGRQRTGIKYYVNSVIYPAEQLRELTKV